MSLGDEQLDEDDLSPAQQSLLMTGKKEMNIEILDQDVELHKLPLFDEQMVGTPKFNNAVFDLPYFDAADNYKPSKHRAKEYYAMENYRSESYNCMDPN